MIAALLREKTKEAQHHVGIIINRNNRGKSSSCCLLVNLRDKKKFDFHLGQAITRLETLYTAFSGAALSGALCGGLWRRAYTALCCGLWRPSAEHPPCL